MSIFKNLLSENNPKTNSILIAKMIQAGVAHEEIISLIELSNCPCFHNIYLKTDDKDFDRKHNESINVFFEILKTNSYELITQFFKIKPYYSNVSSILMNSLNQDNVFINLIGKDCVNSFKALKDSNMLTHLFFSNILSPINKNATIREAYLKASDELLDMLLNFSDEKNILRKIKYCLIRENQKYLNSIDEEWLINPLNEKINTGKINLAESMYINVNTFHLNQQENIYMSTTLILDKNIDLYEKLLNILPKEEKIKQIKDNLNYLQKAMNNLEEKDSYFDEIVSYLEKQKLEITVDNSNLHHEESNKKGLKL